MTPHELLSLFDPWLSARCRYIAAQLPWVRAEDLYQESVEEFLRELPRWLQQAATTSIEAQARALMAYCLGHARTRALRGSLRDGPVHPDPDPDPHEPEGEIAARELLARVRAATTPPRALCLLSLWLPAGTEVGDAERAKAWTKGGSRAVPRPIGEAWGLFDDGRRQPRLVADDVAWRSLLGLAWYTEGPPETVTPGDLSSAAENVGRYANHARADLRRALLADGADA